MTHLDIIKQILNEVWPENMMPKATEAKPAPKPTGTWQYKGIRVGWDESQLIQDLLDKGWEPYAVHQKDGFIYHHLRRQRVS